jgi:hypothetical protein
VEQLVHNCPEDLTEGPCIQGPEDMVTDLDRFQGINSLMADFMDGLAALQT